MAHVRHTHTLQTSCLYHTADAHEIGSHIIGQRLNFGVHRFIQGFYRPSNISVSGHVHTVLDRRCGSSYNLTVAASRRVVSRECGSLPIIPNNRGG